MLLLSNSDKLRHRLPSLPVLNKPFSHLMAILFQKIKFFLFLYI
ncbi:hypothetical protein NEISICOT_03393 [Neisseria sicca ATCC 29256]|uniref:Uncharacterized protein n=1 Tax=Neisseria sicca ATCC 29256 TaxID=547045 RepID=C6MA11_NEISI|nr:hypothetical protein NEISICOT_03393 [Neisseria sicca ATCC 29256]